MDKPDPPKLTASLNPTATNKDAGPAATPTLPTPEEKHTVVAAAIAAAMPEFKNWGTPAVLTDRSSVGHGAHALTDEQRADALADRALAAPTATASGPLDPAAVRRAHAAVNGLFASFSARGSGSADTSAEAAVRDIVDRMDAFEKQRQRGRDEAVAGVLMTELPAIYERVLDGALETAEYDAQVRDLLASTHLLPDDPALLERVLEELVVEKSFINTPLDNLPCANGSQTSKLPGPVETAAYALSMALDVLGVRWPHGRGVLVKRRKLTEQAKATALSPSPFGTHVGPSEAAGYAAQAIAGGKRELVELPSTTRAPRRDVATATCASSAPPPSPPPSRPR